MDKGFDKERAHHMFYKMIQIDRLHRNVFESMHSAFGIHRSQHRMLMYLSRTDSFPSQKEIAEHFEISPAAVAVSLKKLEECEYITRESLKSDSRLNRIFLTDKGKMIVEKTEDFFAESDYAMFCDFSEEDYTQLDKCLKKMTDGLKNFYVDLDKKFRDNAAENN